MNYELETINCSLCGNNNYEPYITNAKEFYGGSDNFFTVEKIVHQSSAKDLVASAQYLDNKLPRIILKSRPVRKIFVKPFVFLLARCGKKSRMSVYAKNG